MKTNKIIMSVALLGLCGGLLVSSGCAHTNTRKPAVISIDKKKAQAVTNDTLINCNTLRVDLTFLENIDLSFPELAARNSLDLSTKYPAQSIAERGDKCIISFNPRDFSGTDLKSRGYFLYLYQNDECVASYYYSPYTKPFFSSVC